MIQDGYWRTTMTTQTEWKWLARWVRPRGGGGRMSNKNMKSCGIWGGRTQPCWCMRSERQC